MTPLFHVHIIPLLLTGCCLPFYLIDSNISIYQLPSFSYQVYFILIYTNNLYKFVLCIKYKEKGLMNSFKTHIIVSTVYSLVI